MHRTHIIFVLLALAIGSLAGAGAITARLFTAPAPETQPDDGGTKLIPAKDAKTASHADKHPEDFGFPSYPGAESFHSMESGKESGSAAYEVRKGSAEEITRFYIEKLGAKDWQYVGQEKFKMPSEKVTFPAIRTHWASVEKHRVLTLLALDDPQNHGFTAQALLSWNRLEVAPSGASSRSPRP